MYCAYIYAHKDKDKGIKIVTIDIMMNNKQTFFPKILMSKTKISKFVIFNRSSPKTDMFSVKIHIC